MQQKEELEYCTSRVKDTRCAFPARLLYFELDELKEGDEIDLEDLSSNLYRCRGEELFRAGFYNAWVADTLVARRDLPTLRLHLFGLRTASSPVPTVPSS
jgi:hypothetical protein